MYIYCLYLCVLYIYKHTHTLFGSSFHLLSSRLPISLPSDSCQSLPCIHASVSLLSVYFVHYFLHMRDHMRFVFFCLDYFSVCFLNTRITVSEVLYVPLLSFFCGISAFTVDYCIH